MQNFNYSLMIPEGQIETDCLGTCETSFARREPFLVDLIIFVKVFHCILSSEVCANTGSGAWDFSCLLLSLEILGHKGISLIVKKIGFSVKKNKKKIK